MLDFVMLMYPLVIFGFKKLHLSLRNKWVFRAHLAVSLVWFLYSAVTYTQSETFGNNNLAFTFITPLLFLLLYKLFNYISLLRFGRYFVVTNRHHNLEKDSFGIFDIAASLMGVIIPLIVPPLLYELLN